MSEWFVWREGETLGPLSSEQLASFVRAGKLGRDDWLWHPKATDWILASTVDFLWHNPAALSNRRPRSLAAENRERPIPSLTRLYLEKLKQQSRHVSILEGHAPNTVAVAAPAQPSTDDLEDRLAACLDVDDAPLPREPAMEANSTAPESASRPPPLPVPPEAETEAAPAPQHATADGAPATMPSSGPSITDAQRHEMQAMSARRIRDKVADALVRALDRLQISSLGELTNKERLAQLAHVAFECLPSPIAVEARRTIGRDAFEDGLAEIFTHLAQAPTARRDGNLRGLIRAHIHSPWLVDHVRHLTDGEPPYVKRFADGNEPPSSPAQEAPRVPPPLPPA